MKRIFPGRGFLTCLAIGLLAVGLGLAQAAAASTNNLAAAATLASWKPLPGAAPGQVATQAGREALHFKCAFAGIPIERASWDRAINLDLGSGRGVELRIFCRNPAPVSHFSLYFQSGAGWYQATFFPETTSGWNTLALDKREFQPEGNPAGWSRIQTIRLSCWRGRDENTEFWVSDLRELPALPPPSPRGDAAAALEQTGRIASYADYAAATNGIARAPGWNPRAAAALEASAARRASAVSLLGQENYREAQAQAAAAQQELTRAYCLAQEPERDEFRAFWCHSAFGVSGREWDEAIRRLAENGFTAILPNMLWGGVAFYDSKVLPVAPEAAARGDQIRQCLAACRKYGLQLHVWKVDWYLGRSTPKAFVEKLRGEHRLQADSAGKEEPWLCPSHPDNQQLEIAALLEVVRNYDVDGIHFDYIRYPDNEHCFCPGCRERFGRVAGAPLAPWPREVLAEGPLRQQWLDWRRSNITAVVRAVSQQARAIKPRIKISAAVFRNWVVDRNGVGQDWKPWCDQGYLDFVCPMDYTPILPRFENMVAQQVEWAGKVPCYPGIGVSASSSRFGVDRVIEEINVPRRFRTRGFVIFNYGAKESDELVPLLGMGITRKR
jgi:uncharacterized lipoprotein YddW (UPF0748 family)